MRWNFAVFALASLSGCALIPHASSDSTTHVSFANSPLREDMTFACSLNRRDLDERKRLLADLTVGVVDRKDLEFGIAYRFDPAPDLVARLGRLVDLERDCCQFMRFSIVVDQGDGPTWLELTGPPAARSAIEEYFGRP